MSEPSKPKGLVTKLAEVMEAVGYVPKLGKNEFSGYAYATESDLTGAIRPELAKRRVIMIPNVKSHVRTEGKNAKGNPKFTTDVEVEWTVKDGETGEQIVFMMPGCADDTSDKSLYKAITGSEKFALKNLFLVSTGDDPEKDDENQSSQVAPPRATEKPNGNGKPPDKVQPPALPKPTSRPEFQVVGRVSRAVYIEEENVFRGEIDGRSIWVRQPELGQEFLDSNGCAVTVTLRSGTKDNLYQLISLTQIIDTP